MPSGSIGFIAETFNITDENQLVLPISVFLIGYIVGPLFLGPLSEVYGRRPLLVYTFVIYLLFTVGTALVNNFPGLLVLRFLAGTAAASPLAVVGGVYADLFEDQTVRGRTMALFGAGTTLGPTLSPIISGFLGQVSWRWPFWFTVIFGGLTIVPLFFWPESFAPVLLSRRAARMREEQGRDDIVVEDDPANIDMKEMFSVTLTRPVTMFFTEPIVSIVSSYMAFVYAVMYMFFQGYPVIYKGRVYPCLSQGHD
jgi:multidrug resistance protein